MVLLSESLDQRPPHQLLAEESGIEFSSGSCVEFSFSLFIEESSSPLFPLAEDSFSSSSVLEFLIVLEIAAFCLLLT